MNQLPPNNYVPINDCWKCLEHFLLYTDFGLSEATAGFLAGLYHVTEEKGVNSHFSKLAQELLRGRCGPRNV
jgi:hypothetical protein